LLILYHPSVLETSDSIQLCGCSEADLKIPSLGYSVIDPAANFNFGSILAVWADLILGGRGSLSSI